MNFKEKIQGTWRLKSFDIKSPTGELRPWGETTHGLLIYSDTNHMSVSINRKPALNEPSEAKAAFDSILFYSGTYEIKNDQIVHQVTEASNPTRIGKEMIRFASLEKNLLCLTTPQESFGIAILVWEKVEA